MIYKNKFIEVSRTIKDRFTQKVLGEKHQFIDSLFHEGIIVNIPALSKKRRDEIETLLSIFDQANRHENHHIMNVKETNFPDKFKPIIRRLQAAAQEKDVRDIMNVEDDFPAEMNDYEHRLVENKKLTDEAFRQKEEAIRKQQEERRQKEEAIRKQEEAVKLLLRTGMPKEDIAKALNVSLDYLDKLSKN